MRAIRCNRLSGVSSFKGDRCTIHIMVKDGISVDGF